MAPRRLSVIPVAMLLLAGGCSSVSVQGVVRSPDGAPVPDATFTLRNAREAGVAMHSSTRENGCFGIFRSTDETDLPFVLTVEAPSRKPLTLDVRSGRAGLVVFTLAPETGGGESSWR